MANTLIPRSAGSDIASTDTASTDTASTDTAASGDAVTAAVLAALDETTPADTGPMLPISRPAPPGADRGTRAARDDAAGREPSPASITATTLAGDRVLIQVRGRLDRMGIARLRTALAQARGVGTPRLVVDLAAVTWWDRSLVGALAWARLQLRGHHQNLILTGATTRLRAEIDAEENTLGAPLWRGPRPGDPRYRPETADQP